MVRSRGAFLRHAATTAAIATVVPSMVRAADSAPAIVNVGAIPLDTLGVVYYAYDLGYFKNNGIDARLTTLPAGPQAAVAVVSGSLDVAINNITTVAAAHLRGIDLKFFAPVTVANDQSRTDLMMVAADSPAQKASDLNGKTIGISAIKSMQQVTALAWMDKHGGDAKSVKFVEVPFPEMAAALTQHRVDAANMVEPFITASKGATRSLGDVLDGVAPTFMELACFSSGTWLAANPAVAVRFATALRQAAVWANAHPKESAAILLRYAKLDPDVAASMSRATYGTTLTAAMLQPPIDAAVRFGVLDKAVPAADILWEPAHA